MKKLSKHLNEQIQSIPKRFLRRAVAQKLKEHDIEDDELINALTEHITSKGGEHFHWEGAKKDQTKKLNIVFTTEDTNKIIDDIQLFIKNGLPKVVLNTVKSGAKLLVKNLEGRWPEQKIEERNSMRHFSDRLELRWAKGLDPLHMMLIASREVGQEFLAKLSRSKSKKNAFKREALVALHMRSCQTAMEILTLLECGLSDGAFARWRTLYEISVVAFAIDKFGDEMAEQYFSHDTVSIRETIINEYKHGDRIYDPALLQGEDKDIESAFQEAVQKYGKSFASPYGWAASSLGNKSPRFQDLEEAIAWKALPPNYKWSSYKVHAGAAGTVRSLGSIHGSSLIISGASNAGLETPAANTAYSLLQITSLLFGKMSDIENQIKMQSLIMLREKVVTECRRAAKSLEKDEMEIRKG